MLTACLHQSDVYSFGIVLWQIAHPGQAPYANPTRTGSHCATEDQRPAVRKDRPAGCTAGAWDSYKDLMKRCWAQPKNRPTFQEVDTELVELLESMCG